MEEWLCRGKEYGGRMEKSTILSKLNLKLKDYNNQLEKILEGKLFSFDVKNLLLIGFLK